MHEEYLKEIGFKGSKREEIARRMNLRVAQADRYNQLNKVIFPLLDMVDKEVIGISHVTDSGLYTHAPEEQEEILQIINECLDNGVELTRPVAKKIVDSYREGKRTWLEVIQLDLKDMENNAAFGTGVSVMNVNTEPQESKEDETSPLRNEEINYDYSHREGLAENDQYKEERLDADDYAAIEKAANNGKEKEEKPPLTPQEKKLLAGEKVLKSMEHLESAANEIYEFESAEKAQLAVKTMESIIKVLLAEMEAVADKNDFLDSFNESLKSIIKEAEQYKE